MGFGDRGAHLVRPFFKFPADTIGFHGLFLAIPGKSFNPDSGDIASQTPETLHQCHLDPCSGGSKRRRQTTRARPDNQHIGFMDNSCCPRGFFDKSLIHCNIPY